MTNTVSVVAVKNGKVLLVKSLEKSENPQDIFGLPAGRLDEGESFVKAAVRELQEETGLITTEADLVQLPTEHTRMMKRRTGEELMTMKSFACLRFAGELKKSNETEPAWFPIHEIKSLYLMPNVDTVIDEAIQKVFS